jgi:hypothetical protein
MNQPVLRVEAGLLLGTGSDRTGAGVTGRSCVIDSMVRTCAGAWMKTTSWKLYPPPEDPARNIAHCSLDAEEPSPVEGFTRVSLEAFSVGVGMGR